MYFHLCNEVVTSCDQVFPLDVEHLRLLAAVVWRVVSASAKN